MAGGKLTPRQKMINMMYLVLTALLAMNVSAEVLESFQQLADALRVSADKFGERNHQLAQDIKHSITSDPANRRWEVLIPRIDAVTNKTDSVIGAIDAMRDTLYSERIGGGRVEGLMYHILNKSETEKNLRFWMMNEETGENETANGGRGAGKARILKDMIDEYVSWANRLYQELDSHADSSGRQVAGQANHFQPIAIEPKDLFPDDPAFAERRNKTWEQFNFIGNPVVANLAILEKIKNDLNVIETDLLQKIRSKIDNLVFKIDSLIAVSAPESEVVIAGMQFKTKLYVTVASTQMTPRFGAGVRAVDNGRSGEMVIPANGSVIPQGQQEGVQSYATTISVPKADGTTQVINVRGTFKVRRPEVVITSDQVQILYAQCANLLNVDVPALGNLYNPVIQARGGTAEVSPQNKKKVRVVPAGGPLELIVKQNTNGSILELDRIRYRVIPPPRPTLQFGSGGQQLQSGNNIRAGGRVAIRAVPDASFAQALPNDARYAIGSCQVMIKRGLGTPQVLATRPINAQQGEIALAGLLQDARPGEQVILKLDRVSRINFQNRPVEERFDERELIISLTVQP